MATIKYVKKGKKTYVYIVENSTVIDDSGSKKTKRKYIKSLGILNRDVSKSQAKTILTRYETMQNPIVSDITVKDLFQEFSAHYEKEIGKTIKKRTYESFAQSIKHLHFIHLIESRKITYSHIEKLKSSLIEESRLSNRSINLVLIELKKGLQWAKKKGYVSEIPDIDFLRETKKEILVLSKEELRLLLKTSTGNAHFYIYFMVFTGMRPNEFMNLNWADIDFIKETITIRSDNKLKSGRKISIHKNLLSFLQDKKKEFGRVCPYANRFSARTAVIRAGTRIGIKITPYSLRKTFASMMAEKDVSVFKLAKMMGHSSISTTFKYYVAFENEKLKQELEHHPLASDTFI